MKKDQRQHSPVNAVSRLAKRCKALGTDRFQADLAHLAWLAKQVVEAERGLSDGLRDAVREFGLQFRATCKAITEYEDAVLAKASQEPVVLSDQDWKLQVIEGGTAEAVSV